MNCDVGKATERLTFRHFTYVTANSPSLPSLYLRHSSFSNPCVASPTVHRCGQGGSMRACHAADPGSIPGRVKFPGWGFFGGFSSPVRQMSGSFRPPRSPNIIWPSLSSSLIIHYGRQWPEMMTRPKTIYIYIYIYNSFLHTHLIHFVSFHFISPCDGETGVVGRHPSYSQTFNVGSLSHPILRPDPVSDMSWWWYYSILWETRAYIISIQLV